MSDNLDRLLTDLHVRIEMERLEKAVGWCVHALDCEDGQITITGPYSEPAAALEAAARFQEDLDAEMPEPGYVVSIHPLMPTSDLEHFHKETS